MLSIGNPVKEDYRKDPLITTNQQAEWKQQPLKTLRSFTAFLLACPGCIGFLRFMPPALSESFSFSPAYGKIRDTMQMNICECRLFCIWNN